MAQNKEFRGVARAIFSNAAGTHYVYHRTAVVTVRKDNSIVLDSGGHRTATTKLAMNQASNQAGLGFKVYQKSGDWRVKIGVHDVLFNDGLILTRN